MTNRVKVIVVTHVITLIVISGMLYLFLSLILWELSVFKWTLSGQITGLILFIYLLGIMKGRISEARAEARAEARKQTENEASNTMELLRKLTKLGDEERN